MSIGLFNYEIFYVWVPNFIKIDFFRFLMDLVERIYSGVIMNKNE